MGWLKAPTRKPNDMTPDHGLVVLLDHLGLQKTTQLGQIAKQPFLEPLVICRQVPWVLDPDVFPPQVAT